MLWRTPQSIPKPRSKVAARRAIISIAALGIVVLGIFHLKSVEGTIEPFGTETPTVSTTALPLTFVENQGQWDTPALFVARSGGLTAHLKHDGLTLQLERRTGSGSAEGVAVQISFEGVTESVRLEGECLRPNAHNFFFGSDPSGWRSKVPGYASVVYHDLYDGIGLRVREGRSSLEYDLLLAEGADLSQVVMRCQGITNLGIQADGSLSMETALGPVMHRPPTAWYQLPSGERDPVEARFRKIDAQRYGFEVPGRDPDLALVIDPKLEWSSFCGGTGMDGVLAIKTNASGAITLVAETTSPDLPCPAGAYQDSLAGEADWFVACVSPDGDALLWATYLGGRAIDWPFDLHVDDSGQVTVAGLSYSDDFPVTEGAFDTSHNGMVDAVVARLNEDGSELIYSTFLGSLANDWALDIVVDDAGEAIVSGITTTGTFPTTPGAFDETFNGGRDIFVTRLNDSGTDLVYSTFLGGAAPEGFALGEYAVFSDVGDLALHSSGDVIVTGSTLSWDFPTTPGAYNEGHNNAADGFVTRLSADGSSLVFSTFLGGNDGESVDEVLVDDAGTVTLGGFTWSTDFPTTSNAFDTTHNGASDVFVAQLDPTGSELLYSTFVGGSSWDFVAGLLLDVCRGAVLVSGGTWSDDFPITPGAYDSTFAAQNDVFLFCLLLDEASTEALDYSTFMGHSWNDFATDLAPAGDPLTIFMAGATNSPDFPTTPGVWDSEYGDPAEGFLTRWTRLPAVDAPEPRTIPDEGAVHLSRVVPNPTYGEIEFNVDLRAAAQVRIGVFDVAGRQVQQLMNERLPAGVHPISHRLEGAGARLTSGVYFLRLEAEGVQKSREFTLLR